MRPCLSSVATTVALMSIGGALVYAQGGEPPATSGAARAGAGTKSAVQTGASIRKTPDGQPDIQGVWQGGSSFTPKGFDRPAVRPGRPDDPNCQNGAPGGGANTECAAYVQIFSGYVNGKPNYGAEESSDVNPTGRPRGFVDLPDSILPFSAEGKARHRDIQNNFFEPPSLAYLDSAVRCLPQGLPRGGPGFYQFLQTPGQVVLLQEFNHVSRVIPINGQAHLRPSIRLYNGDPMGRWEGNTLVVETTNFIGGGWFDLIGTPFTDALRMTEQFKIVDANTLDYVVTINDLKMWTRPWSYRGSFVRVKAGSNVESAELMENACAEGGGMQIEHSLERPNRPLPPRVSNVSPR